jgi:hypothetical protein
MAPVEPSCAKQQNEIAKKATTKKMQRDMDSLRSEVSPASTGDVHPIVRRGALRQ